MNDVQRAYAVLGLRDGSTHASVKRRYRALVKTWHPDCFASDPQGQAEASVRMRAINAAYLTLLQHRGFARSSRSTEQAKPRGTQRHFTMIEATRKSIFSRDYLVREDLTLICTIAQPRFRDAAVFTIAGERYQIRNASTWWSLPGIYVLVEDGSHICRAARAWPFQRFFVTFAGHKYALKGVSPFRREFVLQDGLRTIGHILPGSFDGAKAELPAALPQHVRVFMLWLVIIMSRGGGGAA